MASTGLPPPAVDYRRPHTTAFNEKSNYSETPIAKGIDADAELRNDDDRNPAYYTPRDSGEDSLKPVFDSTHRKLKPRHIQLIGIGGTIGTALYVQIGHGLIDGGPGSLFIAFTLW